MWFELVCVAALRAWGRGAGVTFGGLGRGLVALLMFSEPGAGEREGENVVKRKINVNDWKKG